MTASFPFSDLHSFKDYVGFVSLCAPELFPLREGLGLEDQWTMQLAFQGLRYGLNMVVAEKGRQPVFERCVQLVNEAEQLYQSGDARSGLAKLSEMKQLLTGVRTQ